MKLLSRKEPMFRRRLRGYLVARRKSVSIGKGCVLSNVDFTDGVTIEDYVRIIGDPRVIIGRDAYINCFSMIAGEITIGANVLISQYVNIWGRAHRFQEKDRLIWDQYGRHGIDDQGYDVAAVAIGRGAWIGPHVTVFRGITIGEGAVIGANSVVTGDVPAFGICYGTPARVVRYRT